MAAPQRLPILGIINKSYLACFHYNLEKANWYDVRVYEQRQLARKNFDNSKNHDEERLKKALEQYKKELDKDFERLVKAKN